MKPLINMSSISRIYNLITAKSKKEISSLKASLDAQKGTYQEKIREHDKWFEGKEEEVFFLELNRFYAKLVKSYKKPGNTNLIHNVIDRVRSIRRELGQYAIRENDASDNGLIAVPVTLCDNEDVFLLVDTGASRVTVTREILEVLGLSEKIGELIESAVAGGMTVKGPEVIIPSISVYGVAAQNVPGIVIPHSSVGAD